MALRKPSDEPEHSLSFAEVFPLEVERTSTNRVQREVAEGRAERPTEQDLIGLAFSGGGIRSATFNLGVIEALAGAKLLRWLDYLSTVSGGGYIGSWLSSWTYHVKSIDPSATNHIGFIEDALCAKPKDLGDAPEAPQIRFLRQYSNYLTPRLGALSGDTLAFVGTYIRNLLLNQSILISLLFSVLLAPASSGIGVAHAQLRVSHGLYRGRVGTRAAGVDRVSDLGQHRALVFRFGADRSEVDSGPAVPVLRRAHGRGVELIKARSDASQRIQRAEERRFRSASRRRWCTRCFGEPGRSFRRIVRKCAGFQFCGRHSWDWRPGSSPLWARRP